MISLFRKSAVDPNPFPNTCPDCFHDECEELGKAWVARRDELANRPPVEPTRSVFDRIAAMFRAQPR